MNSVSDLLINLVIIGLIAAIAEEIFFRGILQQIFKEWSKSIHSSVLITAFLFSAIHMQFSGFLPRFILGILLGYMYYWTKTIWIPIIIHFINNGIIVILSYKPIGDIISFDIFNSDIIFTSKEIFFSSTAVILLLYLLYKISTNTENS